MMHRMQFLAGKKPILIQGNWKEIALGPDFYLTHCPDLAVNTVTDLSGKTWCLLGIAIQTHKDRPDPLTELSQAQSQEVPDLYKTWNGRWLLVSSAEVHIDYGGTIGCFYTEVKGNRWVSNSLAVLQQVEGLTPRPEVLRHRVSIEWFPLPLSRFEGVYKLLPSQVLDLHTFRPKARPLPQPIAGITYEEAIQRISERMTTAMANLYQVRKHIVLALTSGYDSRTIAAACHAAHIPFTTYTQEHKRLTPTDFALPPRISRMLKVKHRYFKRGTYAQEKQDLYEQHTAFNIDDADKEMYSHGEWDHFKKGDVILRGGMFAVGKCYAYGLLEPNLSLRTLRNRYLLPDDPDNYFVQGLQAWIDWVKQTPTPGVDWRNRYFLEQRTAGWNAAIEQSLDLTGTERFYIVNSYEIVSLFYSVPEALRQTNQAHLDLIANMCPSLLRFGFNQKVKGVKRWLIKASKARTLSFPELIGKIREKFQLAQ